jgi:hypothetical protein
VSLRASVVAATCPCTPHQASIAPELTGITSSTTSHGLIDSINRALFGGRLVYYSPSYFFNLLFGPINFFNASKCIVVNPYCYNKAACKKLYEKSLELVDEVRGCWVGSSAGCSIAQVELSAGLAAAAGRGTDGVVQNLVHEEGQLDLCPSPQRCAQPAL